MNIIFNLLCGFIGVIIHSVIKWIGLQKDAKAANERFSFPNYMSTDAGAIVVSFLSVFLWLLIFPEVSVKYPELTNWERSTYAVLGGFGSYICQKLLSVGKKRINAIVDAKTNIADEVLASERDSEESQK